MSDESEKVGYKNPPRSSRFKPGQSGNPTGGSKKCRSIKPQSLGEALKYEMEGEMSGRENGRIIKLTKMEAWIKKIYTDSMNGDSTCTRILKDLLLKYRPEDFKSMKAAIEEKNSKYFSTTDSTPEEAEKIYREALRNAKPAE